jgi:UPF0176 protein
MSNEFQIISFYEFKSLGGQESLVALRDRLRQALLDHDVCGTIIIAGEGYNASLCGRQERIAPFLREIEGILESSIDPKSSFDDRSPFRKHEVRIKPEIVTLKQTVDISLAAGTHIDPREWNALISDPDVFVLDTRNDYEYQSGTFRRAVNPQTAKFSELPEFVEQNMDPAKHRKVAMFCTGGIRCEKFAPFMREKGFSEVFQLRGGILKYLEEVPESEQLWEGECFVFDERVTLNERLEKGSGEDLSQRHPTHAVTQDQE